MRFFFFHLWNAGSSPFSPLFFPLTPPPSLRRCTNFWHPVYFLLGFFLSNPRPISASDLLGIVALTPFLQIILTPLSPLLIPLFLLPHTASGAESPSFDFPLFLFILYRSRGVPFPWVILPLESPESPPSFFSRTSPRSSFESDWPVVVPKLKWYSRSSPQSCQGISFFPSPHHWFSFPPGRDIRNALVLNVSYPSSPPMWEGFHNCVWITSPLYALSFWKAPGYMYKSLMLFFYPFSVHLLRDYRCDPFVLFALFRRQSYAHGAVPPLSQQLALHQFALPRPTPVRRAPETKYFLLWIPSFFRVFLRFFVLTLKNVQAHIDALLILARLFFWRHSSS